MTQHVLLRARHFCWALVFLVLGAAYGTPTERGDDMFVALTERFCAAIRDHGSIELVRTELGA